MAKNTSNAKTETAFPAFDAVAATDQFRTLAEKGVEQSSKAYVALKDNAEAMQKAVEETLETARTTGSQWSLKALSAARANTEAAFDHLEALAGVTSISQLVELQTAYLRRQSESTVDQIKEMQAAATKATEEVFKPLRDVYTKSLNELKAA